MASPGALMRNEVLLTALSRKLKETCRVIVHYKSGSSGNLPELKPHDRTTRVVNINSQAIIIIINTPHNKLKSQQLHFCYFWRG